MEHNDRHDSAITSLGRYWDELLRGRPANGDNLDPALAETIRQLHARDDAPGADEAFAARLLTDLEDRKNTTYQDLRTPTDALQLSMMPSTNSRTPISPPWLPLPPRASPRRWGWPMTQFATAALVVVTLTFAYLAFGPPRSGRQDEPAAWIPASLSTPASPPASPAAGPATGAPLVEITLPAVGMPATIFGALTHFTIPPGSSGRYEPTRFSDTCCTGFRLSYVLEGTYTVRGDGPMQVMRNGTDTWKEMWVGTEIVVTPGDALLSRMEDSFDATNAGSTPVELLDGELFEGDVSTDPIPQDRSGASAWRSHDQDILLTPQVVPPGSVILRLQQATLPIGGVLPPPPGVILHWAVSLDAGAVVITEKPDNPDAFSLRNLGVGPATVYVLSLQSAGTEAEAGNPLAAGTSEP